MNTTLTRNEDSGAHAVLADPDATMAVWDPENDDLNYGRHTCTNSNKLPEIVTVEDILRRRTPDEILAENSTAFHDYPESEPVTVDELRARLRREKYDRQTTKVGPVTSPRIIGPRRPPAYTGTWWEHDTTPVPGVIVGAYRPDQKQHHDPDATVGFVPLSEYAEGRNDYRVPKGASPVGYDEYGRPGVWEREIPAQTMVGNFEPIDTRVKKIPWYKQAWHGLFTKKGPNDL